MIKLKTLLENFKGEIYDLCYHVLETNLNQEETFEYVCKNFFKVPENGSVVIEKHFSEEEFEKYDSVYEDLVIATLNTNIKKCNLGDIEREDFYKTLWNSYCTLFSTKKGLAYAFYITVKSKSIPFRYLGRPLSMSNNQFRSLTEKNKDNLDKLDYIKRIHYSQRTERASLLMNCLDEIEDYESKIVTLAYALSKLEEEE